MLTLAGLCWAAVSMVAPAHAQPQGAAVGARPAPASEFAPIPPSTRQTTGEYRIRPLDKINVIVFQVPALTLQDLQVDSTGQMTLPLVGVVPVAGRTTTEISTDIAARLRAGYMRDPQVTVMVSERAPEKVTVQGAVNLAGVFEMRGRTSLSEAVAMAHGTNRTADPRHVAIVRSINGQPHAAVFDMEAINHGTAPNPEVLGDDVIVVNDSRSRVMWRNVVEALPLLGVLNYLF
jgi:polysaccharide export outer membrane protein